MSVIEIKVPAMGESVTEVTLSQWLKKDGDIIKIDEPICEFESDKATLELPAEIGGRLTHVAKEGADLKIGDIIAKIDTEAAAAAPVAKPVEDTPPVAAAAVEPKQNYATGHPSPAAAKIMAESGVATTVGTGKDGRVTKEDAAKASENAVKVVATSVAEAEKQAVATPAAVVSTEKMSRNIRREKMSRMRKTIAKRLVSAKNNTAMLTTFNEIDLTEVMALRDKYQERFVAKYGIKLGFMSLFAKACAKTLMEMPEVNAMIDGEDFIYHDYADISIAVSTPTGLVVPPVFNVESLSLSQIEHKIKELAEKARSGKLTMDEMTGGTFTITNGGVFGSMMSTPIINEPQSAILGMHAIQQRAVVVGGEIKIRPMMYVAMSYDHRVIDGSSSVTFLVKVKKLLEDPMALMLDL